MDFAKMVGVFDARSVSFLAVTKQSRLRAPRDTHIALSSNDNRHVEQQVSDSPAPQIDPIPVATSSPGRNLEPYTVSDVHHPIPMA
jgi:hypothetical protein